MAAKLDLWAEQKAGMKGTKDVGWAEKLVELVLSWDWMTETRSAALKVALKDAVKAGRWVASLVVCLVASLVL